MTTFKEFYRDKEILNEGFLGRGIGYGSGWGLFAGLISYLSGLPFLTSLVFPVGSTLLGVFHKIFSLPMGMLSSVLADLGDEVEEQIRKSLDKKNIQDPEIVKQLELLLKVEEQNIRMLVNNIRILNGLLGTEDIRNILINKNLGKNDFKSYLETKEFDQFRLRNIKETCTKIKNILQPAYDKMPNEEMAKILKNIDVIYSATDLVINHSEILQRQKLFNQKLVNSPTTSTSHSQSNDSDDSDEDREEWANDYINRYIDDGDFTDEIEFDDSDEDYSPGKIDIKGQPFDYEKEQKIQELLNLGYTHMQIAELLAKKAGVYPKQLNKYLKLVKKVAELYEPSEESSAYSNVYRILKKYDNVKGKISTTQIINELLDVKPIISPIIIAKALVNRGYAKNLKTAKSLVTRLINLRNK